MKIQGYEIPIFYKVFAADGKLKTIILKKDENKLIPEQFLKVVSCFVIDKNNNVLMEKRANKGLSPGMLDLCSGHIDNFETPTQTMLRELEEELGIDRETAFPILKKVSQKPLKLIFNSNGKRRSFFTYFYCLKSENYEIEIQHEEVESIEWKPLEECFDFMRNGETRFPKSDSAYEEVFNCVRDICLGSLKVDRMK